MNIDKLKVFKTVAELKSFTKAAEELYMTQPAISKNIKYVEEFYGVVLFHRIGNQIELTEAGIKLLRFAKDILKLANEARETLSEDKALLEEKIMLGAGSTVGVYILPQVLEKFVKKYPNIQFTLEISNARQVFKKFSEGSLDIGVVGALVQKTNLDYLPFTSEQLQLIVSKHHPWAQKPKVSAFDLKTQPFLIREKGSGLRYLIEEKLCNAGVELDNVTEMPNNEAILKLVEAGLGVSIMSENVIAEDLILDRVKTVRIEGLNLEHFIYILFKECKTNSKSLKKFINFFKDNCNIISNDDS